MTWSDVWEDLPHAPDLVPRSKDAQITLRLSPGLVDRVKTVANLKGLPYHALARSWLIEAVRAGLALTSTPSHDDQNSAQLNLKLDAELLDEIKRLASKSREPYHKLARELIESGVAREEKSLGVGRSAARRPPVKELMVLLLHASNPRGDVAIRGMTRLQKLLFVVEQQLDPSMTHFYAFNYGPFNEEVNDAADALRLSGYLDGEAGIKAAIPTFAEMVASAEHRAGPRDAASPEVFELSKKGHEAAENLRRSSQAYERLFDYVAQVRAEWDDPNLDSLVHRVYESWPQYAEKSVIRDELAQRMDKGGRR